MLDFRPVDCGSKKPFGGPLEPGYISRTTLYDDMVGRGRGKERRGWAAGWVAGWAAG